MTGRRRWPLLAIGASAGTATWSGWVGLGELTGFGVVHPLPGIWDELTVNTAVTLPIGVEAYAMYALSVATSSRPMADRVRRYAWASSAAALVLGMAGQVAYHVMTAHGRATGPAPWWVTALVSCLPVLVLGAASLLWHLAGLPGDDTADPIPAPEPIPTLRSDPPLAPDRRATEPASDRARPTIDAECRASSRPRPIAGAPVVVRAADLDRARAAIDSGDLPPNPTATAIRTHLAISPDYARATRDALRQRAHHDEPTTHPKPPEPQEREADEIPGQEHIQLFTEPDQPSQKSDQHTTDEKQRRKEQDLHTNAVALP